MQQVQKQHAKQARTEDEVLADKQADTEGQGRRAALDADIDDLLADIDAVLEPNAQAFVAGYIQQGGE